MKYVIFENEDKLETVLVFPNHIPHRNMANDTVRQIAYHGGANYPCPTLGRPVSAGFITFSGDSGVVICDGSSDSLNLLSRKQDAEIVRRELNRGYMQNDPKAVFPK